MSGCSRKSPEVVLDSVCTKWTSVKLESGGEIHGYTVDFKLPERFKRT